MKIHFCKIIIGAEWRIEKQEVPMHQQMFLTKIIF
jgi:hypothetical protein